MKNFVKSRGWLFPLKGGPYAGHELRIGWLLPNGERIPLDEEIKYPNGTIYRKQRAYLKTGEPRTLSDGTDYFEYVWVEGTGE